MTRPLGKTQLGVLKALDGRPWPGGWYWGNASTTIRVLNSLVKRGYAAATTSEDRYGVKRTTYRITEAGQEALAYAQAA